MDEKAIKYAVILFILAAVVTSWSIFFNTGKSGPAAEETELSKQEIKTTQNPSEDTRVNESESEGQNKNEALASKKSKVLSSDDEPEPKILGEIEMAIEEPMAIGTSITIERENQEKTIVENTDEDVDYMQGVSTSFSIEE